MLNVLFSYNPGCRILIKYVLFSIYNPGAGGTILTKNVILPTRVPKNTGMDQNEPERTKTDMKNDRNGLEIYRNGLEIDRNGL